MLILEENESLSDNYFGKYCDSLSASVAEMPGRKLKTANIYS